MGTPSTMLEAIRWTPSVFCLERKWKGQIAVAWMAFAQSGIDGWLDIHEAGPGLSNSCQ